MSPELRIYNQPNIVTSEADIKTNLLTDKFMTMNFVQNQEYFNIRYQIKPFMVWIWISVILICFGGLISLFKKKFNNLSQNIAHFGFSLLILSILFNNIFSSENKYTKI